MPGMLLLLSFFSILFAANLFSQQREYSKEKGINPEVRVFTVDDVQGTIDLYTGLLGFKITMQYPETEEPQWAVLRIDTIDVIVKDKNYNDIYTGDFESSVYGGSVGLMIPIANIDSFYTAIRDSVVVRLPLKDNFYDMRKFAIEDNNGYILIFTEKISE